MAHQSRAVPIRNQRSEPISWPTTEEPVSQTLPVETAEEFRESSTAAVGPSFRTAQQKVSGATTSLIDAVRRFADERPLQFVAIVAGISLLAGVALRIWRSRHYA